jgi:hypothetical protein
MYIVVKGFRMRYLSGNTAQYVGARYFLSSAAGFHRPLLPAFVQKLSNINALIILVKFEICIQVYLSLRYDKFFQIS